MLVPFCEPDACPDDGSTTNAEPNPRRRAVSVHRLALPLERQRASLGLRIDAASVITALFPWLAHVSEVVLSRHAALSADERAALRTIAPRLRCFRASHVGDIGADLAFLAPAVATLQSLTLFSCTGLPLPMIDEGGDDRHGAMTGGGMLGAVVSAADTAAGGDDSEGCTLPSLEVLDLGSSPVPSLAGVGFAAPALRQLLLVRCTVLADFRGIGFQPFLERIDASNSSITSLAGLEHCRGLREVLAVTCRGLADLSGLPPQGCRLRLLSVGHTAITSLNGLAGVVLPELRTLLAPQCENLRSWNVPPSTAPMLEHLDLSGTAITSLAGLDKTFPLVQHLDVSQCEALVDFPAPAPHPPDPAPHPPVSESVISEGMMPSLRVLNMSFSPIAAIHDLKGLYPALQSLDCCAVKAVTSPLARFFIPSGLPATLHRLDLSRTAITDMHEIATYCPRLTELNVSGCAGINRLLGGPISPSDASLPAAHFTSLSILDISETSLTSLHGLGALCPALTDLRMRDCQHVRDFSGMTTNTAPSMPPPLTAIEADRSGLVTLAGLAPCTNLQTLSLAQCVDLKCLDALFLDHDDPNHAIQPKPFLRQLDLNRTEIASLASLGWSTHTATTPSPPPHNQQQETVAPQLTLLSTAWCTMLRNFSGLGPKPKLRVVNAYRSGISSCQGLEQCPSLAQVNFRWCDCLTTLEGLPDVRHSGEVKTSQEAPAAEVVTHPFSSLSMIDVSECEFLDTRAAIARDPRLAVVLKYTLPQDRITYSLS